MTSDAGGAIAPDIRIDAIPGMARGGDGRVRGVVLARGDAALVDRVLTLVPPASDGHAAPVHVLDTDGVLQRRESWGARVRLFQGRNAVDTLLSERKSRIELCLPECVASVLDGQQALPPALHQGLLGLASEQDARHTQISRRLDAVCRERGARYWQSRFADLRRPGASARVLVLTSRYSTYIRFAAQDLVEAMRQQGHDAMLFMEPDDHETLTSLAYLDAIERHDPDLIVAINFPRWAMGGAVPAGWPHVCWVQDAMPHLFAGKGVAGPLDFVIGHVYFPAMKRAGYGTEQLLEHMMCVSLTKFHPGATTPDQRDRLACDVAYVSHRSETPGAFAERFLRESGFPESARGVLDAARTRIDSIIDRWSIGPVADELQPAAAEFAAALGRGGDPRATEVLAFRFVRPYAEQRLRHQTLEWVADLVRRHGLSFRIFGKGWESHPTLSEFACGPLVHGDDLRASYQLAAAHLHMSIEGCGHQRVAECVLSGGLPLCRRSWAEIYYNHWQTGRHFMLQSPPADASLLQHRWPGHRVADHAELMQLVRFRVHMPPGAFRWHHPVEEGHYFQPEADAYREYYNPVPQPHARTLAMFGDPIEATFSTREELESRLLRAVARGEWRRQMVAGIAGRAAECVGASRFATRMLRFVTDAIAPAISMTEASTPRVMEAVA